MRRQAFNPLADMLGAIVSRLAQRDGSQVLDVGAITDGQFLKRSGSSIVSAIPDGATGGAGTATYFMLPPYCSAQGATNDGIGVNNRVKLFRFFLDATITVNSMSFKIQTNIAGKFIGVGVYDTAGNRLIDTGPVSITTAGVKNASCAQTGTLTPGMYWLGWTCDDNGASWRSGQQGTDMAAIRDGGTGQLAHATNTSTAGQLPSTTGTIIADSTLADSIILCKLQA